MSEKEFRPFKEKNVLFQVWIKDHSLKWFRGYLLKVSHGDTDSERFRQFLYDLQELELKGKHIIEPKPPKEEKPEAPKLTEQQRRNFCLKRKFDKWTSTSDRERKCAMCKVRDPSAWKACQEIKSEESLENLKRYMEKGG